MTPIVKTVTRGMGGIIFLYGVYIVLHGHLTPGGGFAGGVLVAAAFVLHILANGSPGAESETGKSRSSLAESLGIFAFWLVGMAGLLLGAFFFRNLLTKGRPFHLFSAGFIPLSNIAIAIEVAGALLAVFITLAILTTGEEK